MTHYIGIRAPQNGGGVVRFKKRFKKSDNQKAMTTFEKKEDDIYVRVYPWSLYGFSERVPANTRQPIQNEICEFIERSLSSYFIPNPPVS
jgi:hypothetical protein